MHCPLSLSAQVEALSEYSNVEMLTITKQHPMMNESTNKTYIIPAIMHICNLVSSSDRKPILYSSNKLFKNIVELKQSGKISFFGYADSDGSY